jgi:hypothetical protein
MTAPKPKPETLAEFPVYNELLGDVGRAAIAADQTIMELAERDAARHRIRPAGRTRAELERGQIR